MIWLISMCENNDNNIIVFVTSKTLMLCCNNLVNFWCAKSSWISFFNEFRCFFFFFAVSLQETSWTEVVAESHIMVIERLNVFENSCDKWIIIDMALFGLQLCNNCKETIVCSLHICVTSSYVLFAQCLVQYHTVTHYLM